MGNKQGSGGIWPRKTAILILQGRFDRRVSLNYLFNEPDFHAMCEADQSLCRELVSGVFRNFSLLDFYIRCLTHRPFDRIEPVILWVLRISLYQMEFLRVPDHAAIHQAGGLCQQFGRSFSRGFVNAILREFQRSRPDVPSGSTPEEMAIRFSHPLWLVRRWCGRYGEARTRRILEHNNTYGPSTVWVNLFVTGIEEFSERLAHDGIEYSTVPGIPGCVQISTKGFVRHPLYRSGQCFFMDASSQRVVQLATLSPGPAGDVCAAPGGKSFLLSWRLGGRRPQVCSDVHWWRLGEMRTRASELGLRSLDFVLADAESGLPFGPTFGILLVDVPCSGLGTIRSNPDLRWFVEEEDLSRFQRRQSRILTNSFQLLRSGGALIYSTCSTEPEENEKVVEGFLGSQPAAFQDEEYLKTSPDDELGDGFFAVRIGRR